MTLSHRLLPRALPALLGLSLALPLTLPASAASVPSEAAPVLERISAASMRGNLSFLASDALEGRGTPSRGLDIAAEFIASQFRAAGLEPLGDDGYFQTADWNLIDPKRAKNPPAASGASAAPAKVRNVVGILRGSDPALKALASSITDTVPLPSSLAPLKMPSPWPGFRPT